MAADPFIPRWVITPRRMRSMRTGGEPGLHDVAAEHDDHGPPGTCGVDDGRDDAAEVARDEDVGEGVEKGSERAIVARGAGELVRADLVGAPGDGDGVHARQVGLWRRRRSVRAA